jgi:GGDEF domain-containing protein
VQTDERTRQATGGVPAWPVAGPPGRYVWRMAQDDRKRFTIHDRALVVGMGVVLALLAFAQFARKVDTPEVVATLLLFAILVAIAFFDVVGGVIAGLVSTVIYAVLRLPVVDVLGSAALFRSVVERAAVFIGFGAFGGYAHRIVRLGLATSAGGEILDKRTSCLSARSVVYVIDNELARAARYKREFSVITIDLGSEVIGSLGANQQAGILKELGDLLHTTIRATDHASIVEMPDRERIVLVLPETPLSGAGVFMPRLVDKVSALLLNRNAAMPRKIGDAYSSVSDVSHIRRLRNELARIANVPMLLDMGTSRS